MPCPKESTFREMNCRNTIYIIVDNNGIKYFLPDLVDMILTSHWYVLVHRYHVYYEKFYRKNLRKMFFSKWPQKSKIQFCDRLTKSWKTLSFVSTWSTACSKPLKVVWTAGLQWCQLYCLSMWEHHLLTFIPMYFLWFLLRFQIAQENSHISDGNYPK